MFKVKAERGFEVVSRCEGRSVILPYRKTKHSAGYDFHLVDDVTIGAGEMVLIPTGVKAFMKEDEVLYLFDRSSNYKKYGTVLVNSVGVIDSDYYNNPDNEGEIHFQIKNVSGEAVSLKGGTAIMQGVFMKFAVGDDTPLDERKGGFGSTDK